MGSRIWEFYVAGGWVMHPITACSLVATTVVLWKLLQLARIRVDHASFLGEVRARLLNGRLNEASALCDGRQSPIATVVKAGLTRHNQDRDEVEAAMETVARHELARIGRGLGALATIVNLAPLIGFFGTVQGMIVSFDAIHGQGLSNPALVAGGISQALHTTAWGLIVAFVTLPFHNLLAARVAGEARGLELASDVLLETFAEMERLGTRA